MRYTQVNCVCVILSLGLLTSHIRGTSASAVCSWALPRREQPSRCAHILAVLRAHSAAVVCAVPGTGVCGYAELQAGEGQIDGEGGGTPEATCKCPWVCIGLQREVVFKMFNFIQRGGVMGGICCQQEFSALIKTAAGRSLFYPASDQPFPL